MKIIAFLCMLRLGSGVVNASWLNSDDKSETHFSSSSGDDIEVCDEDEEDTFEALFQTIQHRRKWDDQFGYTVGFSVFGLSLYSLFHIPEDMFEVSISCSIIGVMLIYRIYAVEKKEIRT